MKPSNQIWGHLAAFFTIFVWGITFISTKVLLVIFSPLEIMFFRLVMAVVALFIASPPGLARGQWNRTFLRNEWKPMVAGLCGVTLYFMFQNIALTYTLAANVSVLVSVAPLFTALVSRAVLHEKLKTNFLIGFSAAIAGIILVAFNGSLVLKLNPLGDLLSILAALAWAFYSVTIRKINAPQSSMIALTRKVFTYGLLFMLPALPLFQFRLGLERLAALPNLLNLLFLGVVASALCFVTWNFALHRLGPVKTSIYIYLVPVITVVTSAIVLRESITLVSTAGMILILIGMALSERNGTLPARDAK
jgi:drug/metabolite transporter (DMT)-like permease